MGPASIEEMERINIVMSRSQGAEFPLRNPYTMNMDRSWNRNCYTCRGFGYLAKNCRNQNKNNNRRMETEDNNNLKEEQDLIVFD